MPSHFPLLGKLKPVIATVLVGGSVLLSSQGASQAADIPLRVAYVPTASLLPAYVAKERDFFKANGLAVTMTPTFNSSLLPATLGLQSDIAISTQADLLKSAASGLDVVAICGETIETTANHYIELIVRKDSGITKITDLKGKVIATPTMGAGMHTATLYWLRKNGIDASAVRAVEVPFPNMADQLKSGRVDAVEATQPFVSNMLAAGNVTLGDPNLHISDPALGSLWIAKGAWARDNRKVISAWIASLNMAIAFIGSNPAQARVILGKYTHLPKPVVQNMRIPHYQTALVPSQLDVWIKILVEMKQLAHPLDAEKLIVTGN